MTYETLHIFAHTW